MMVSRIPVVYCPQNVLDTFEDSRRSLIRGWCPVLFVVVSDICAQLFLDIFGESLAKDMLFIKPLENRCPNYG